MFCNVSHGHDFVSDNTPKSFFNKEWLGTAPTYGRSREKYAQRLKSKLRAFAMSAL